MIKIITMLFIACMSVCSAVASVKISSTSKEFPRDGGASSIVTSGSGTWSATSDVVWITITPRTTGAAGTSCIYLVEANDTANTRIGHITIADYVFTVRQTGALAEVSPHSIVCDNTGTKGFLSVIVDEGVLWSANSPVGWISVQGGNNVGSGQIEYEVLSYNGLGSRSAEITVAGSTIEIIQTGVDLLVSGKDFLLDSAATIVSLAVDAAQDTRWSVSAPCSWVQVMEGSESVGQGSVILAILRNNSVAERIVSVSVGSQVVQIRQRGIDKSSISVSPKSATVAVLGERATVSVSATQGLNWYAESLDSWIEIDGTAFGTGNGKISYIASSNPGVEVRNGTVRVVAENPFPEYMAFDGLEGLYSNLYTHWSYTTNVYWHKLLSAVKPVYVTSGWKKPDRYGRSNRALDAELLSSIPNVPYFSNMKTLTRTVKIDYMNDITDSTMIKETGAYYYIPVTRELNYDKYNPEKSTYTFTFNYVLKLATPNFNAMDESSEPRYLHSWSLSSDEFGYEIQKRISGVTINLWAKYSASANDAVQMFGIGRCDTNHTYEISLRADGSSGLMNSVFHRAYGPSKNGLKVAPDHLYIVEDGEDYPIPCSLRWEDWHMYTLVYEGTKVKLYVDGQIAGSRLMKGGLWLLPDFWKLYDSATVDDFKLFDAALSASEIGSLYETERQQCATVSVSQPVAPIEVSCKTIDAPTTNSTTSICVTAPASVMWEVRPKASWISVAGDSYRYGSDSVMLAFAENTSLKSRKGIVEIAGENVSVMQAGVGVKVKAGTSVFGRDGGLGEISVSSTSTEGWSVSSDASWITIMSGDSGVGVGTVMFLVDETFEPTRARMGIITIGGETVLISQRAFDLSVDEQEVSCGSAPSSREVFITAPEGCAWSVVSNSDWIKLNDGTKGIGSGSLSFDVLENTTGMSRTGALIVAGEKVVIWQSAKCLIQAYASECGEIKGVGEYDTGATFVLMAQPHNGYVFSHWTGGRTSCENPLVGTVDGSMLMDAHFVPEAAAEKLAVQKAAQGGFYTRAQIHNLEIGNLVLDVDATTGKARVGVRLQETSDLANPNWQPVEVSAGDVDLGSDGTVGIKASAKGNAKFFRVVTPNK